MQRSTKHVKDYKRREKSNKQQICYVLAISSIEHITSIAIAEQT